MTDTPSEAAIEEALWRTGGLPNWDAAKIRRHAGYSMGDAILAHAKTLQEVDRVAREMADCPNATVRSFDFLLHSLMLPDPVDPLEEAMAAAWPKYMAEAPAALKGQAAKIRAELDKRGLTIAPKEQGRLTDGE